MDRRRFLQVLAAGGFWAGGLGPSWGAPAASRFVLDQAGRRVALPPRVERLATPGISLASLALVLGAAPRLVGVAGEVRANPWLTRIFPSLAHIPIPFSGAGLNGESLLAQKPDLVLLWGDHDPRLRQLEGLGMPVFCLRYTVPAALQEAAMLLGAVLGGEGPQRARRFVAYYRANLEKVAAGLTGLAEGRRPRVYYASMDPLHTEGRASLVDAWISAAGGVNVAARAGIAGDRPVGMEEVLTWNPQIIVVREPRHRLAMLADSRWRGVAAVRNGRVLVNPKGVNAWCTRGAEAALQVLWAAKMFHPERFPGLEVAGEGAAFYREFYGYALNREELGRMLAGEFPP